MCHHADMEAVAEINQRALRRQQGDLRRLDAALGKQILGRPSGVLVAHALANSRLTINFHPDRVAGNSKTVAENLLASGRYLPQQLTGISNGGRFGVGGPRAKWEHDLFGEPNEQARTSPPVYGTLDLAQDPHGGAPRFGSCFIVLNPSSLKDTTFSVGDSHDQPSDVGTSESFIGVLAGLFEQAAGGGALDRALGIGGLLTVLADSEPGLVPARELDGYVEAQLHGGIELGRDVAEVVLDPSFRSTEIEDQTRAASELYGFEVEWHSGSVLDPADIPDSFRGPEIVELAGQLAGSNRMLDVRKIGDFASTIPFARAGPQGDLPTSERQKVKFLWHCLLRFGHDSE